jgi:hypothetical protein
MGRVCSIQGDMRNDYIILVAIPYVKSPLGRSRRKWENNIKMYLKETECECVEWINWFYISVMKDVCEHGNTLSGSMKAGTLFTKFL